MDEPEIFDAYFEFFAEQKRTIMTRRGVLDLVLAEPSTQLDPENLDPERRDAQGRTHAVGQRPVRSRRG